MLHYGKFPDWRMPYIQNLEEEQLPPEKENVLVIKKKASRYLGEGESLFRRSFEDKPLLCLDGGEILQVLSEVQNTEH